MSGHHRSHGHQHGEVGHHGQDRHHGPTQEVDPSALVTDPVCGIRVDPAIGPALGCPASWISHLSGRGRQTDPCLPITGT